MIESDRAFAGLEGEWGDLHRSSPSATPFQSWGWLYSWWEHYGAGYELRLVAVRSGGSLVGAAPLMLDRRGLGRLLFLGASPYSASYSSYMDVLVRWGWEREVSGAVCRALRGMGGWVVADLQELRPGAAAWGLFERWDGPKTHIRQAYCTLVEARPWDEVLASLGKSYRSTARRTLRQAEADGVRCELAAPEEADEAASRLLALNREQWRERWEDTGPEHWSRRFESHLRTSARRMAASGLGAISESWRDGEVIVSTFLLFGRDFVGLYMVGAGEEARRRYSYSSLFVRDMLDIARDRGVPYINFFLGEDPYKLRWRPEVVHNHRVILGKNPAFWGPYAGYLVLRTRAVRYAKSGDAPGWIREAPSRYRRLRYKAARIAKSERTPRWIRSAAAEWIKGV